MLDRGFGLQVPCHHIVRSSKKLTPELLIGAAWRADVVHIVLYAVLPLLWEAARYHAPQLSGMGLEGIVVRYLSDQVYATRSMRGRTVVLCSTHILASLARSR